MILKDYICSWRYIPGWHSFKLYHDEHDRFHLAVMRVLQCYWRVHGCVRVPVRDQILRPNDMDSLKKRWATPRKERHLPEWRTLLQRRATA